MSSGSRFGLNELARSSLRGVTLSPPTLCSFSGYEAHAVFDVLALREATPSILKQHKVGAWTSLLEPQPVT